MYLVTDTVGFIKKLPHQVVEAFKATLEETVIADLILHVVDASVPEDMLGEMMGAVDDVLDEIGAGETNRLLVLNKADLIDPDEQRGCCSATAARCLISAQTGEGLDELRRRIEVSFSGGLEPVELLVPYERGRRASRSCTSSRATWSARTPPSGVRVRARVPAAVAEQLRRFDLNGRERRGRRLIVEFTRLHEDARAPEQAHEHDAGYDLFARESARIEPGARASVGTGIAVAIPEGMQGSCCRGRGLPHVTASRSSMRPG